MVGSGSCGESLHSVVAKERPTLKRQAYGSMTGTIEIGVQSLRLGGGVNPVLVTGCRCRGYGLAALMLGWTVILGKKLECVISE